jgi:hypothetical protein
VVEITSHHRKIEGSSPTAPGTGGENVKTDLSGTNGQLVFFSQVAQWVQDIF